MSAPRGPALGPEPGSSTQTSHRLLAYSDALLSIIATVMVSARRRQGAASEGGREGNREKPGAAAAGPGFPGRARAPPVPRTPRPPAVATCRRHSRSGVGRAGRGGPGHGPGAAVTSELFWLRDPRAPERCVVLGKCSTRKITTCANKRFVIADFAGGPHENTS